MGRLVGEWGIINVDVFRSLFNFFNGQKTRYMVNLLSSQDNVRSNKEVISDE